MKEDLKHALTKARMTLDVAEFIRQIKQTPEAFSAEFAKMLDEIEPLPLQHLFKTGGFDLTLRRITSFETLNTNALGQKPWLIKDYQGRCQIWGYKDNQWQLTDIGYKTTDFDWKRDSTAFVSPQDEFFNTLQLGHTLPPITPMAGHSLGPLLFRMEEKLKEIIALQTNLLHEAHFPETREMGGDFYRIDRNPKALKAMRSMLGDFEDGELLMSHLGLSDLLGEVLPAFYNPKTIDWKTGKTGICFLGKEFLSDQLIIRSTLERELERARGLDAFTTIPEPSVDSLMLAIEPDKNGIYDVQHIIKYVKDNAHRIRIFHMSDIVFLTGQRLAEMVLPALKEVTEKHQIVVGLDLAHTIGNKPIDLPKLTIYAVGCSYKFVSGTAGTGGFLYVKKQAKCKPIQGWTAVKNPGDAFKYIDGQKPENQECVERYTEGAYQFSRSNPSPISVAALQEYAILTHNIGWDKILAKSECLTQYMKAMLEHHLGEKLMMLTPEDPKQRGSMLVFQIKGILDVKPIESLLKEPSRYGIFDIDVRPPYNIRISAPIYTKFSDIYRTVARLTEVVQLLLKKQQIDKLPSIKEAIHLTLHRPEPSLQTEGLVAARAKL